MLGMAILGISHYSEYGLSSTLSTYSTLIVIVLRNYDDAFSIIDFHLFYDGVVYIQIK